MTNIYKDIEYHGLVLGPDPTDPDQAATKAWVEAAIAAGLSATPDPPATVNTLVTEAVGHNMTNGGLSQRTALSTTGRGIDAPVAGQVIATAGFMAISMAGDSGWSKGSGDAIEHGTTSHPRGIGWWEDVTSSTVSGFNGTPHNDFSIMGGALRVESPDGPLEKVFSQFTDGSAPTGLPVSGSRLLYVVATGDSTSTPTISLAGGTATILDSGTWTGAALVVAEGPWSDPASWAASGGATVSVFVVGVHLAG